jgi:hypothetical protein
VTHATPNRAVFRSGSAAGSDHLSREGPLIVKAREFDVKDETTDPDPGSNPSEDMGVGVL